MEMTGLWKAWKAKDASPSSHEPLGNLANGRRDSHIPTAPATRAGGKAGKPRAGFPLFHRPESSYHFKQKTPPQAGLRPAPGGRRSAPLKSKE
jgi:hypothetical protein